MNKNGYSIIEILIVLSIMAFFSVLAMINYSKQKSDKDLLFAVRQLSDDIRISQNSTADVLKFNGSAPLGGYGVKVSVSDNSHYVLFADTDGNKAYTNSGELVKTASLPQGIVFDSVTTSPDVGSGTANIVFNPPYGVVYINGNSTVMVGSVITLNMVLKKQGVVCSVSPADCLTVSFTSEGRVIK